METALTTKISIGPGKPLALIAGPCVIESEEHVLKMAALIAEIAFRRDVPFIFKASFDKANRTSVESYRGPGFETGLEILAKVKERAGCPVLTDIHESWQAGPAAEIVDVLQIPAFLCRQTDLLLAAGKTGRAVNIKKGQFLAPEAMALAVRKVKSAGNDNVCVTERGTTFGHGDLVVDFRGLEAMREFAPVIFDGTHSVQRPPTGADRSGGRRSQVFPLCRAAAAVGVDAFFIEVHDDPDSALSDGPNMITPQMLDWYLPVLKDLAEIAFQ